MKLSLKTPLYQQHRQLNAQMMDFHGWLLPVEYSGIIQEVQTTRQSCALFDVSHMGEILVAGKNARQYLQGILTNDLDKLFPGKAFYSPMCLEDGGTIDDLMVCCLSQDRYLLVVNAANTMEDLEWLQKHRRGEVEISNLSDEYALLALQGPTSQGLLQELTPYFLSQLKKRRFLYSVPIAGIECLVSRTGYTGEDGFELFCSPGEASSLWEAIWETGQKQEHRLSAAGLGARDVLRLEASLPLYGQELSSEITPLEAGLDFFVALDKTIPFIGQEALQKQQKTGLSKKLAGLESLKRGIPRHGYPVALGKEEWGWVSSGTYSPTLQKPIALAFLPPPYTKKGTQLEIVIRGRNYPAQVVKTPFIRRES